VGYVEGPQPPVVVDCEALVWDHIGLDSGTWTFTGLVSGLPTDTQIVLSIDSSIPAGITITGTTSTSTDDIAGNFTISTSLSAVPRGLGVLFTVPAYGCTHIKAFEF